MLCIHVLCRFDPKCRGIRCGVRRLYGAGAGIRIIDILIFVERLLRIERAQYRCGYIVLPADVVPQIKDQSAASGVHDRLNCLAEHRKGGSVYARIMKVSVQFAPYFYIVDIPLQHFQLHHRFRNRIRGINAPNHIPDLVRNNCGGVPLFKGKSPIAMGGQSDGNRLTAIRAPICQINMHPDWCACKILHLFIACIL